MNKLLKFILTTAGLITVFGGIVIASSISEIPRKAASGSAPAPGDPAYKIYQDWPLKDTPPRRKDEWLAVAMTNNNDVLYVREDRIIEQQSGWFKLETEKDKTYSLTFINADCSSNKVQTSMMVLYDKNGRSTSQLEYKYPKWRIVIPDTLEETIYDIICRGKPAIEDHWVDTFLLKDFLSRKTKNKR